jgi:pilus assembly protein CpaB
MNLKSWIPLGAAVLLGLIALVVARKALSKTGTAEGKTPALAVVVAGRDLPPGRELTADDLAVTKLSAEGATGQWFNSPAELVGRTVRVQMRKGDAVMEPLLAPTGTKGGLAGLVPDGFRAMTVEVNEFSGLAGMIVPGSKVDVIAVLRDDKSGQPAARTILQNIEVRAVGRNVNPAPPADGAPPPPPSNNVTMLLTPKSAQILQLATQNGRPWLVLRGGRDTKEVEAEMTTLAQLRNEPEKAPDAGKAVTVSDAATRPAADAAGDPFAGPRVPAARVVQVIRGGVETTVTFATPPAPQPPTQQPPVLAGPAATPATRPAPADAGMMTGTDLRPAH